MSDSSTMIADLIFSILTSYFVILNDPLLINLHNPLHILLAPYLTASKKFRHYATVLERTIPKNDSQLHRFNGNWRSGKAIDKVTGEHKEEEMIERIMKYKKGVNR